MGKSSCSVFCPSAKFGSDMAFQLLPLPLPLTLLEDEEFSPSVPPGAADVAEAGVLAAPAAATGADDGAAWAEDDDDDDDEPKPRSLLKSPILGYY